MLMQHDRSHRQTSRLDMLINACACGARAPRGLGELRPYPTSCQALPDCCDRMRRMGRLTCIIALQIYGVCAPVPVPSVGTRGIGPRTTWDPVKTPCPCKSTTLCQPISHPAASAKQGVYVMHGGFTSPHPGAPDDSYMWTRYQWDQITTIAVFGTLSAELYCHAHAHGARVTFGYEHTPWERNYTRIWQNATLVSEYARDYAAYTLATHTDGWCLDIEAPARDPKNAAQLTTLVRAISDVVHQSLPSAQTTFAAGIMGFENKVDQYDLVGISEAVDLMLVMCYEADKNLSAPAENFQKANMPLPLLKKGVAQYAAHGIPASKLILAWPWFAWNWKCSMNATTGKAECDQHSLLCHCEMAYDIANNTIGHSYPGDVYDCSNDCQPNGFTVPGGLPCLSVMGVQQAGMIGEEHWDEASSTPFLRWRDNDPALELWFDNPRSLALKSEFARSVGAGGVSMWNANSINYHNASQVASFWGSFRPFTQPKPSY